MTAGNSLCRARHRNHHRLLQLPQVAKLLRESLYSALKNALAMILEVEEGGA
jgi:hypothetical protein